MAENISTVLLTIFFVLLSVLYGRFFCGRICPMGLMQDLLNKIPFPKKIMSFKYDKYLRYLKYALLILMVAANLFGYATASHETQPFNVGIAIGWAGLALLSMVISRPLCKYLCPVGPILGWCNRLPFGQYKVNHDHCTQCGVCLNVCKMNIVPYKTPNHIECIRCGKCKKNCPTKAITSVFLNPSADSRKAKIKTTARVIESEK